VNTKDATPDGAYPTCSIAWLTPPSLDAGSILDVPADAGTLKVILHGKGVGTQNYTCKGADGGTFSWVLVGPEAKLDGLQRDFHHRAHRLGGRGDTAAMGEPDRR
jgi:hypothetical protein